METEITIKANVPAGWRAVAYRVPKKGDHYLYIGEVLLAGGVGHMEYLILERAKWRPVDGEMVFYSQFTVPVVHCAFVADDMHWRTFSAGLVCRTEVEANETREAVTKVARSLAIARGYDITEGGGE